MLRTRWYTPSLTFQRSLKTSPTLYKSIIPSIILDELRDTSNLAQPIISEPNATVNAQRKQIFLKPEQVADKRFERIVAKLQSINNFRLASVNNPILDNRLLTSFTHDLSGVNDANVLGFNEDPIVSSVEKLQPFNLEISQIKYQTIKASLIQSFKKLHLKAYLETKYKADDYTGVRRGTTLPTKSVLAERIMNDIWKITKSNKITALDDLLDSKLFKLYKSDLFLLLLESGYIIKYLSRVGVKITFDPKEDKILFLGTTTQVNNAEIILTSILNTSHREKINLTLIKELFKEKYEDFTLNDLVRNTEVYFSPLENDVYELITLNRSQIKKSMRLLMWQLNYNEHLKEYLFMPEKNEHLEFVPYKDDDTLSFDSREKNLFELQDTQTRIPNKGVLNDLAKFSDEALSTETLDFERDVENSKALPGRNAEELDKASWDLLDELGLMNETVEGAAVPESVGISPLAADTLDDPPNSEQIHHQSKLSQGQIDSVYNKLIDFSYSQTLNGVSKDKLNKPIITITLGNILFEGKKTGTISDIPTFDDPVYTFSTKASLVNDKVLSLPMYEYPTLQVKEINHFLNKDPHNYVVQMKFAPSAFEDTEEAQSLRERIKFPPVEVWVDLNERFCADMDSMNVVTVEGENNCHVSLAGQSDMKVTCQLSGDLLKLGEEEVEESSTYQSVSDMLNSTTQRYERFKSQPGMTQFLKVAKLDFSGSTPISIPSTLRLNIDGQEVKYHYLNVSFRRQINFNYSTKGNAGDRLVQFNVVEGGSLGGRTLEINFVGDLSGNIDKESFTQLLRDAMEFIEEL